ncbi:hypothetical protein, partial [Streptomyces sp. NPDC057909]|uniref:hypothetical protein n=1 Tax=Streptomyces sp. NPDC057909 TaxID=3346277 RepID=UPI0036ED3B91
STQNDNFGTRTCLPATPCVTGETGTDETGTSGEFSPAIGPLDPYNGARTNLPAEGDVDHIPTDAAIYPTDGPAWGESGAHNSLYDDPHSYGNMIDAQNAEIAAQISMGAINLATALGTNTALQETLTSSLSDLYGNTRGAMTGNGGDIATRSLSEGTTARLTRAIENRMEELGIPQENIGIKFEGGRGFYPGGTTIGGNVPTNRAMVGGINIDPGVLHPIPEWAEWNASSLGTRVDSVIAHEWAEFMGATHEESVQLGPTTLLNISPQARSLLETFPGRK